MSDALSGAPGKTGRARAIERARAGFTLTEITVAVTLFAMMAGATVFALTRTKYLSWTSRDRVLALEAAHSALEQVRGETFDEVFARFNATTADDPPTGGPSPGSNFAVAGLTARRNDPDGFVGEIQFPGDGIQLREDVQDREWGMPRDLNLDTQIDQLDHSADYVVLPVRVRVSWRGPSGDEQVELTSLLVED